jgi:hypothetical protein
MQADNATQGCLQQLAARSADQSQHNMGGSVIDGPRLVVRVLAALALPLLP